ncbi:unnamed protein product [Moneuplotes crassus]|uniref:Cyclin N-terminal domain-containing protein n=2 Tax=Euplotes crassus TaxID=5936 RepID=A0AAD1X781_EUPCR|nr:unnamed protein product [Moneuplotes crassus]
MATSIYKIRDRRPNPFKDEVRDFTFAETLSPREGKYMVKAVGKILLEIQNILEKPEQSSVDSPPPCWQRDKSTSKSSKRLKYQSSQALSDDEVNEPTKDINRCADKTYHRRELDQVVSKIKKPVGWSNGSLKLKDLPSSRFPVVSGSKFHCPDLLSPSFNGVSLLGNVYSVSRLSVKISSFVSSFYKHYSIVSYSSFILSLIYIDRFLKSQKINNFMELTKFSITRLFLVGIIVAMKYHEEYYIENNYFFKHASKYCSIFDVKELNELERIFLKTIDYRLKVSQKELNKYLNSVYEKSQELQCKQFRVYVSRFEIKHDYFELEEENTKESIEFDEVQNMNCTYPINKLQTYSKRPQIILNNRLFNGYEEIYKFFHLEMVCDDKKSISQRGSLSTSEESRENFLIFN